jgi:anaerobic selenocysteine-containing dehydrogenase
MRLNRRNFITALATPLIVGGGTLMSRAVAAEPKPEEAQNDFVQFPYTKTLIQRPENGELPDKAVYSGCSNCPAGCRLQIHVKNEKVSNVYGESRDPVQRGKICGVGQALPQLMYNKYRVTQPLKRVDKKPSNKFEAVTWDVALGDIATKLAALKAAGKSRGLVAVGNSAQAADASVLMRRFMDIFGSANVMNTSGNAGGMAAELTFGIPAQTNSLGVDESSGGEDLGSSKVVLWFGSNDAETHPVSHG